MKTKLFALALSSLLFFGCSSNSSTDHKDGDHDHAGGTHTHEDGSVHKDHEKADSTKQEEFKVSGDSLSTKPHDHPHEDGHDHKN